eukprot:scaffold3366_cov365-Prasinococcus_capsulatus_cf.AAC.5
MLLNLEAYSTHEAPVAHLWPPSTGPHPGHEGLFHAGTASTRTQGTMVCVGALTYRAVGAVCAQEDVVGKGGNGVVNVAHCAQLAATQIHVDESCIVQQR